MKKLILLASVAVLLAVSAFSQTGQPQSQANAQQVLTLLDGKSATFQSVQTNFEWDQYSKVADEHDLQSGVMYFRRTGPNVDVAANIQQPDHKKLVFTGGKVQIYSFKTKEVTTPPTASKNREEIESFLALGFGGSGSALAKNFEVNYKGTEAIDGRATYVLELTPKSQQVRNMFKLITLWIDQQTGMSLQQKAMEGQYDYRLAKYPFASMKINQKLPHDAFDLKAQ